MMAEGDTAISAWAGTAAPGDETALSEADALRVGAATIPKGAKDAAGRGYRPPAAGTDES